MQMNSLVQMNERGSHNLRDLMLPAYLGMR